MKKNIKHIVQKALWQLSLLIAVLFGAVEAQAQFTFTDNLRGNQPSDIIIGNDAYFTSGVDDPIGAGWLRLVPDEHAQRGFAYLNRTFPSTMGIFIDFEYKVWRSKNYQTGVWGLGGDGMTLFLFDAEFDNGGFRLGGWGGSLGYATNSSNPYTIGMGGGYIGLGFDNFGYYASTEEGKIGGLPLDAGSEFGRIPNTISIRGATNDADASQSNIFMGGIKLGDRSGNSQAVSQRNEVGYTSTLTPTRPDDATFYRRVQVEIIPTADGMYHVSVKWKRSTSITEPFEELFEYTTTQVPPQLLKMGFAATGNSAINNYEVRNISVTTPNNLRVIKRADKDILRSVPTGDVNQVTYTIEVVNETTGHYTDADFLDELLDINGNPIPTSMFDIETITTSGFTNANIAQVAGENKITGTVSIAPGTTGFVQVTGRLTAIPESNQLINRVSVMPTGNDRDFDLGNNIAEVNTPVIAENVDLMLIKETIEEECLNSSTGNTYELRVANMGVFDAKYRRPRSNGNRIVVFKEVPAGYTYTDHTNYTTSPTFSLYNERWYRTTQTIPNGHVGYGGVEFPNGGTRYIYVARYPTASSDQTLAGNGGVYETDYPIRYTITPQSGYEGTPYTDVAEVMYRNGGTTSAFDTGQNDIELPANKHNNTHSEVVAPAPAALSTDPITVYLCQGQVAQPLNVEADIEAATGNVLNWYLNIGGLPSAVAPTPFTDEVGTTTYYVSQSNGSCEGELTPINVIILEKPTAGSITGEQTICKGKVPNQILNESIGTGFGTLSYLWEYSTDNGNTWNTISGINTVSYQPQKVYTTTLYRRITIAENTEGYSCQSAPTMPVQINVKNCIVITNPMLPSKAKK